MPTLFCDLETYSDLDLKSVGVPRYAERAEVLLWAWAIDDGPVQCWDRTLHTNPPVALAQALSDPKVLQVWHNGGGFDRVVLMHAIPSLAPPIDRVHDTLVQALTNSLPGGLGELGGVMGLPQEDRKHKRGRDLVLLLCRPRPVSSKLHRATRDTHPEEWAEFVDYAKNDIVAMRAIYKKLPDWNYRYAELELWRLDQRINDRGVAIDLDFANGAVRAIARAQKRLAKQTRDLTNGEVGAATQRDKLLAHILQEYGVALPDMQISTLEQRIEDPNIPQELKDLLTVRLQANKTSGAKYKRVVGATSSDGRLRGLLQFCGASRTGRWSGRTFQPQNLPRPTHGQEEIDSFIEAVKADAEDLLFDDVVGLASSAVRGLIVAPTGKKLVIADLANIEGRVVAWLAGESWKLKAFRAYDAGTGQDLYKLAYAKAFHSKPEEVTKAQRQIGKVMELMLGYAGGVGAFLTGAAAYHIDLDALAETAWPTVPEEIKEISRSFLQRNGNHFELSDKAFLTCDALKQMWREAHPKIVTLWKELEDATRDAIVTIGVQVECRSLTLYSTANWLRILLPSGRSLSYPSPRVSDAGEISYKGLNQYSRKWERLTTYSGKLLENATQAVARDVLAANMQRIEDAGYEIVLTVHDEIIAEAPDTEEFNAEHLSSLMATVPSWAKGLPLAAAGFETYRYRKG